MPLGLLSEPKKDFIRHCRVENIQLSGPGGQKRNRIRSGVRAHLKGFPLSATAGEFRETKRNAELAYFKLRLAIVCGFLEGAKQNPLYVNNLSLQEIGHHCRKAFRPGISPSHWDYPRVLLALGWALLENQGDLRKTAEIFETSNRQIVKILSGNKNVFREIQNWRNLWNLPPLKL